MPLITEACDGCTCWNDEFRRLSENSLPCSGAGRTKGFHDLLMRRSSNSSSALPPRRQMSAGQQQESGEESPKHQAYRQSEGAVNFLEIESRQSQNVGVFECL
jgi:hypothetical protein